MVARRDAGRRDLARAPARPGDQHHARDLVLRRIGRRRDRHLRGGDLGLALGLRGTGGDCPAGDLRPRPLPGKPVLGSAAGSQAPRRRGACRRPAARTGGPAMGRQGDPRADRPGVRCRHVAQHPHRHLRRVLQHDHLRHGRRLDADLSRAGASLGDRRIRHLLHLVGPRRRARPDRLGLDRRPDRPARGVLRHAGRGRRVPHAMGVRADQFLAVGVRAVVVDRLSRLLGAGDDLDRRGVPDPHTRRRQRLRVVDRLG